MVCIILQALTKLGTSLDALHSISFHILCHASVHFCGGQNWEMGWELNTTWHFIEQLSQEWQNLLKGCCGISILLPALNRISRSWKRLLAWVWMNVLLWHLGWSHSLSSYSRNSRKFGLCLTVGILRHIRAVAAGCLIKCPSHGV